MRRRSARWRVGVVRKPVGPRLALRVVGTAVVAALTAVLWDPNLGILLFALPWAALGVSGALVLGMVFLFSGIGRVAAGALMDAFDARKVLIGIFAVQVVVFVFMPLMGHEWWQAIVFTLVFGATFGSTVPARPLLIRQFFGPRSFGAVNGLAQGVAIVPAMVGPVMMGASFDAFHSYTPAIMAFAAIMALMAKVVAYTRLMGIPIRAAASRSMRTATMARPVRDVRMTQ